MKTVKVKPKDGGYYDLIHLPHGHFPVPKLKLWSKLPIPLKGVKNGYFYSCPVCGRPSFFKIEYACRDCEEAFSWNDFGKDEDYAWKHYKRSRRRDYFRNFWKEIECLSLPFLVLLGKAWYVKAGRRRYQYWSGEV